MTQKEVQHLFWRAGFGMKPNEYALMAHQSKEAIVNALFEKSESISPLARNVTVIKDLMNLQEMSEEEKKNLFKSSRQNIIDIGLDWLNKMVHDEAQLRERMVLFWHDHFASSAKWDLLIYNQNETIRKHALRSFRDLLHAMCKDAMLLKYLDNQKNRKQQPNENFTRELLELFTLGEGHYTEKDIKEGARAFTGHAFDLNGNYLFKPFAHDYDVKTFMGKSGRFRADEIVDIILDQKQTAIYITSKVYRYFVNENVDQQIVTELADEFYRSDYDIKALMRSIFLSDWFYREENIGTKIKSPMDMIVGLMKQCDITFKDTKTLLVITKLLGQIPFFPPNVSGWPIGKEWIDSTTLLLRMRIADYLFLGEKINMRVKAPIKVQTASLDETFYENNDVIDFDLEPLKKMAVSAEDSENMSRLMGYLLQSHQNEFPEKLKDWLKEGHQSFETMILNIFRLPEYQMC